MKAKRKAKEWYAMIDTRGYLTGKILPTDFPDALLLVQAGCDYSNQFPERRKTEVVHVREVLKTKKEGRR